MAGIFAWEPAPHFLPDEKFNRTLTIWQLFYSFQGGIAVKHKLPFLQDFVRPDPIWQGLPLPEAVTDWNVTHVSDPKFSCL